MNNNTTFVELKDNKLFEECRKCLPDIKQEDRLLDVLGLLIDEIKINTEQLKV